MNLNNRKNYKLSEWMTFHFRSRLRPRIKQRGMGRIRSMVARMRCSRRHTPNIWVCRLNSSPVRLRPTIQLTRQINRLVNSGLSEFNLTFNNQYQTVTTTQQYNTTTTTSNSNRYNIHYNNAVHNFIPTVTNNTAGRINGIYLFIICSVFYIY